MPKGWLYDWEGMVTVGRQNPETRFGRKLAYCLSVCALAISDRCSKDSSCAHKGLVTNWPHHNMFTSFFLEITVSTLDLLQMTCC